MLQDMYGDDLLGDPQNIEEILVEEREEALYLEGPENEDAAAVDQEGDDGAEPTSPTAGKATETKKRKVIHRPQPKLNPERLMGPRGIATLETVFQDFKYLGKGHEKEDLDQVMKQLEHWAHRLFPRLQFDDCLEKIESLGHKKPVMTYVKKIRMGMVTADEPLILPDEIEGENEPAVDEPPIDEFDALISQQLSQMKASAPAPVIQTPSEPSVTLSSEQRERMLKNRLLAEERRLARMKAQREKEMQSEGISTISTASEDPEENSHPEKLPEISQDVSVVEEASLPDVLENVSLDS